MDSQKKKTLVSSTVFIIFIAGVTIIDKEKEDKNIWKWNISSKILKNKYEVLSLP